MFEYVDFSEIPGESTGHQLKLFALSTCGFCRKAIDFLKKKGISYSIVYMDQLPVSSKRQIKSEFSDKFDKKILYPALVVDDTEALIGFTKEDWVKSLGLGK